MSTPGTETRPRETDAPPLAVERQPRDAGALPPDPAAVRGFRVVAFCCHYCAYAAADLAGALRLQSPPSVRVVKLPCTGKVDVPLLLRAIERGADGVMVAGCLEGDCHYQRGNLNARRCVERTQRLLEQIGLEPERVRMFNMSSGMGQAWADAVAEMDTQIEALGPSPLRQTADDGAREAGPEDALGSTDPTTHADVDASVPICSTRVTSSANPRRHGS